MQTTVKALLDLTANSTKFSVITKVFNVFRCSIRSLVSVFLAGVKTPILSVTRVHHLCRRPPPPPIIS